MGKYVLVLDAGTTTIKSLLFTRDMEIKGIATRKNDRIFPAERCVEQDPEEIYRLSLETMREVVKECGVAVDDIECMGITTQRTSWMFWDSETGRPLYNLVTWQDTRGVLGMQLLGENDAFEKACPGMLKTMRPIFPPFGIYQLRKTNPAFAAALDKGANVKFGNVDAWLLYKLTGGAIHATSFSTVSNSIAFDNKRLDWFREPLEYVGVRPEMLPEVREDAGDFGTMDASVLGKAIPVCAMVADQQSAMFAQGCFGPEIAKCTNGTGTFINVNIGEQFKAFGNFRTNIAWKIDGTLNYMCEGNSYTAGSCLEWASRQMELFTNVPQLENDIRNVPDSGGTFFVPALGGLGTVPYLDPSARASFMGIGNHTTRAHFVRAVLDAVAYAAVSVCEEMIRQDVVMRRLSVSGGVSNNDFTVQLMSNLLNMEVMRPHTVEATGLGAAEMAALCSGWVKMDEMSQYLKIGKVFTPDSQRDRDLGNFEKWKKAVSRSLDWL